jgi:PIN domain nuclease of toxin-antitoxin system
MTEPLDDFVKREVIANRLTILSITPEHAAVVSRLEFHHKDPFDRLLVAQAQVEDMAIVSKDEIFDRYGVNRLW